jgi:hypothetical protein
VEYGQTIFDERDAREVSKKVERFYRWVKEKLPG